MFSGLEYIHETLELNRKYISSIEDTVDLLASDLMVALGYDRRRNNKVYKLRDSDSHWRVEALSNNLLSKSAFVVKVVKLGDPVDNIVIDSIKSYDDSCFALFVTDGEQMAAYHRGAAINPLLKISLFDDKVETKNLIEAFQHGTQDLMNFIEEKSEDTYEDRVKTMIRRASVSMLSDSFMNNLPIKNSAKITKWVNELLSGTGSLAELREANENIEQLNSKVESLLNDISDKDKKIEALNHEIAAKDTEISGIEAEFKEYKTMTDEAIQSSETEYESTRQSMQSEIDRYKGLLDQQLEAEDTAISDEINNLNQRIKELELANRDYEDVQYASKTQIQDLENQLSDKNDKVNQLENENTELKNTAGQYEAELSNLKTDYDELKKEYDKYQNGSQVLQTENSDLKAQLLDKDSDIQETISRLRTENRSLSDEIDSLKQLVNNPDISESEKDREIKSLADKVASLEAENARLAKDAVDTMVSNSSVETESSVDYSAKLTAANIRIAELEEQLNSQSKVEDVTSDSDIESDEVDALKQKVAQLESMLAAATSSIADGISDIAVSVDESEELAKAHAEIAQLKAKLQEQSTQVNNLTVQVNSSNNDSSVDMKQVASYRKQIEDLSIEVSDQKELIDKQSREILELQEILSGKDAPKNAEAMMLLNTVTDPGEDSPLSYVGVVGGVLFQSPSIEKFIGQSIQELYKAKDKEILPFLYDGDMFNITDSAVRKDMLLGSRTFDLQLDELSADECIERLNRLFGYFPDIAFLFKTIGNKNYSMDNLNDDLTQPDNEINDDELLDIGDNEEIEFGDTDIVQIEAEPNTEFYSETDNYFEDDTLENNVYCISAALGDLGEILNSEDIELVNTLYIERQDNGIYCIDNSSDESILKSIVYSLINFSYDRLKSTIAIEKFDFSNLSDYIVRRGEGLVRIPHTKFDVNSTNLIDYIPIIYKICELCEVESNSLYFYLDVSMSEESQFMSYAVDISEWVFVDTDDSDLEQKESKVVFSGNILGMVEFNEYQWDIMSKLVIKCDAFKSNNTSSRIDDYGSIGNLISGMLSDSGDRLDGIIGNIFIPGTEQQWITYNQETENAYSISINGNSYFINESQPYIIWYLLLKLHKEVYNDRNAGILVVINTNLLDLYNSEAFECYDPVRYCAISSLLEYLSKNTK